MICLVIPTLSLVLFIQSLYSLSNGKFYYLLVSCPFFAAFSNCSCRRPNSNTLLPNILLGLVSKGVMKQFYFPRANPFMFIVSLLRPASILMYVHPGQFFLLKERKLSWMYIFDFACFSCKSLSFKYSVIGGLITLVGSFMLG